MQALVSSLLCGLYSVTMMKSHGGIRPAWRRVTGLLRCVGEENLWKTGQSRDTRTPFSVHCGGRGPQTRPVPALCAVWVLRGTAPPLPPLNPPRKLRPRRNLPDTPKVSVFSFFSSAHVVRLAKKHRWQSNFQGKMIKANAWTMS